MILICMDLYQFLHYPSVYVHDVIVGQLRTDNVSGLLGRLWLIQQVYEINGQENAVWLSFSNSF